MKVIAHCAGCLQLQLCDLSSLPSPGHVPVPSGMRHPEVPNCPHCGSEQSLSLTTIGRVQEMVQALNAPDGSRVLAEAADLEIVRDAAHGARTVAPDPNRRRLRALLPKDRTEALTFCSLLVALTSLGNDFYQSTTENSISPGELEHILEDLLRSHAPAEPTTLLPIGSEGAPAPSTAVESPRPGISDLPPQGAGFEHIANQVEALTSSTDPNIVRGLVGVVVTLLWLPYYLARQIYRAVRSALSAVADAF